VSNSRVHIALCAPSCALDRRPWRYPWGRRTSTKRRHSRRTPLHTHPFPSGKRARSDLDPCRMAAVRPRKSAMPGRTCPQPEARPSSPRSARGADPSRRAEGAVAPWRKLSQPRSPI
jgi:hypothetical protein